MNIFAILHHQKIYQYFFVLDKQCLCKRNEPFETIDGVEIRKKWLTRAECLEAEGQCKDECQCLLNGETTLEFRAYCNSRQHGGYCLDEADKCNSFQDDIRCLCANNEGTETACIKREDCGKEGEANFSYWGDCTDECYCEIRGCEEGQDCYSNVTWRKKKDCWSKSGEGYYCSVETYIESQSSEEGKYIYFLILE